VLLSLAFALLSLRCVVASERSPQHEARISALAHVGHATIQLAKDPRLPARRAFAALDAWDVVAPPILAHAIVEELACIDEHRTTIDLRSSVRLPDSRGPPAPVA